MVTLLDHQLNTVKRIVAKCQKQRGLVVYHEMGTGKTLTSLTIIMNYPKHESVIYCPSQLKYVWNKEMQEVDYDFSRTKLFSHSDIFSHDFKNKIVIIDEAHNIVNDIRKYDDQKKRADALHFLRQIQESKKIILLSGTPIYNDISDLAFLVNMAAGKDIITYDRDEFKKKYMKIAFVTSLLHGHIIPFFKSKPFAFLGITPAAKYGMYQYLPKLALNKMKNVLNSIPDPIFSEAEMQNYIHNEMYANLSKYGISKPQGILKDAINDLSIPAFLILLKLLSHLSDKYELKNLYSMKYDTFSKDISPYIDYYKPSKASGFPTKSMKTMKVEYTGPQLEEWIKLTYQMQLKDSKKLNEYEKNDQNNTFFQIRKDNYLQVGRTIGNLSLSGVESNKFIKIRDFIRGNPGNHLFYSNFYEKGGLLLSDFFDRSGIKHAVLDPKMSKEDIDKVLHDFKNSKIPILILHFKYAEGISIPGTKYFHILEPFVDFSKYDQAIGRALRTDSHSHLPKNQRNVIVLNWVCVNESFLGGIMSRIKELKVWKDHFSKVYIDKMRKNKEMTNPLTPDQIAFSLSDELQSFKNTLHVTLEKHSIFMPCSTGEDEIRCQVTTLTQKGNCMT